MMTRVPPEQRRRRSPLTWHVSAYDSGTGIERDLGITPDDFFGISYSGENGQPQHRFFFLEYDRGSMPEYRASLEQTSVYRKIFSYTQSRLENRYHEHFGINTIRMLLVLPGIARLNTVGKMLQEHFKGEDGYTSQSYLYAVEDTFSDDSPNLLNARLWDGDGHSLTFGGLFVS